MSKSYAKNLAVLITPKSCLEECGISLPFQTIPEVRKDCLDTRDMAQQPPWRVYNLSFAFSLPFPDFDRRLIIRALKAKLAKSKSSIAIPALIF